MQEQQKRRDLVADIAARTADAYIEEPNEPRPRPRGRRNAFRPAPTKSQAFKATVYAPATVADITIEDEQRVVVTLPDGSWWGFSLDEFEAFAGSVREAQIYAKAIQQANALTEREAAKQHEPEKL